MTASLIMQESLCHSMSIGYGFGHSHLPLPLGCAIVAETRVSEFQFVARCGRKIQDRYQPQDSCLPSN